MVVIWRREVEKQARCRDVKAVGKAYIYTYIYIYIYIYTQPRRIVIIQSFDAVYVCMYVPNSLVTLWILVCY